MYSLLFLLISLVVSVSSDVPQCDDTHTVEVMESCYSRFFDDWGNSEGVTPLPDFFDSFHKNRSILLKSDGVAALHVMKEYGTTLTSCLSPVADCIVDVTYTLPPLSATEGHSYNTDRHITAYESTDRGYELQTRHFYCLRNCENADESQPLEDKCNDDLKEELNEANGDKEKICRAFDKNMQCFKKMYSDCCGAEGGEFKCHFFKAEWEIYSPTCNFTPCDQ